MKIQKNNKLLIFGGAFNPPTLGHEAILSEAKRYASLNEMTLIIIPSGERLDKAINHSKKYRLELLKAMIKDCGLTDQCAIDTRELDDDLPTQTYRTIKSLQKDYPNYDQTWIFGADSILTMPRWYMGDWIMQNIGVLAVRRDGYHLPKNIIRLNLQESNIYHYTSTDVRNFMARRKNYSHLVGPAVAEILGKLPDIYD